MTQQKKGAKMEAITLIETSTHVLLNIPSICLSNEDESAETVKKNNQKYLEVSLDLFFWLRLVSNFELDREVWTNQKFDLSFLKRERERFPLIVPQCSNQNGHETARRVQRSEAVT